jgi:bla regulator protein BlaR1
MTRARITIAALLLMPLAIWAQAERPSFEVVSIKPTEGGPVNSGFRRASPGTLNAINVTVRFLIQYAYDLREDQVTGGPAWIDSERYEVIAKPPEGAPTTEAAKRLRVQSVLADRFHVVLHHATKEMPVFVLVLAKNGPKGMNPSTQGEPDWVTNGHHLSCQHCSMPMIAKGFLAGQTHRNVTDQTGLAGDFDFTLDWSPDAPAGAAPDADVAASQPPFFLALREQLGLKLEPQRGPVEVLVIDRAEKPSAN